MEFQFENASRALCLFAVATALILAVGHQAHAASPCTDGVDCHCDQARDPSSNKYDPRLLFCEDFETVTLTQDGKVGGGAPDFGPWYDDTGFSNALGNNSYWTKNYGSVVTSCAYQRGDTAPGGRSCGFDVCFTAEWSAGDPWGGNSHACIDIVRDGEFDDEVSSLPDPAMPNGSGGVMDGNKSLAMRVPQGRTAGIAGNASLARDSSEVGITMAIAYAENVENSGVWNFPWKHDEWSNASSNFYIEMWNLGNTGIGELPYSGFMFHTDQSSCSNAVANATFGAGRASCSSVALRLGAGLPEYDQKRDFPWGTWACHRAHIKGMGTANMELRLWHNERLVFEMTGFDGRVLRNHSYSQFAWNAYSNANIPDLGTPTTQTTYRYEDNVHVREGVPVSCADINFGEFSGPPPTPRPTAPILLD